MHDIKFRAWDSVDEIMLPVEAIDFRRDCISLNAGDNSVSDTFEMFELMQFTGLYDRKGREIYEGDIIKTINGVIATVEWEEDNGRFLGLTTESERKILYIGREPRVEVIGNIYKNPELLVV